MTQRTDQPQAHQPQVVSLYDPQPEQERYPLQADDQPQQAEQPRQARRPVDPWLVNQSSTD